jgi:hypothetical protein
MTTTVRLALLGLLAACSGGGGSTIDGAPALPDAGPPDAAPGCQDTLEACLAALPGVVSVDALEDFDGGRYLHVGFEQPIDHDVPAAGTFVQYFNVVDGGDRGAPTVLATSGYQEFYLGMRDELALVLGANQVALEHRFFGDSLAGDDWSLLTVRQAAADQHRVVQLLRPVLTGKWVSTGGSKGGMTAIFHRRFYPDDVDGTVPVSAPISFALPDQRYDAFLESIGEPDCRALLTDALVAMLSTHRDALLGFLVDYADSVGAHFVTHSAARALEDSVHWLYWGFWQYGARCEDVPQAGASAEALWAFLTSWSSPVGLSEENGAIFAEPYTWQALTELGLQGYDLDALAPHRSELLDTTLIFRWMVSYPQEPPAHDAGTMHDIQDWLASEGDGFVFLYGSADPWAGGAWATGAATDTLTLWAPGAPHGFTYAELTPADRAAFFARLEAWTGVAPQEASLTAARAVRDRRLRHQRAVEARGRALGVHLP